MPLLTGTASVSRFHVALDGDSDFSLAPFREIPGGDERSVLRSHGFVPMKPGPWPSSRPSGVNSSIP